MYRLKNFICVCVACILCVLLGVGVKAANVSFLSQFSGTRTYFINSVFSQALMKTELAFADLGRVKGECVSFPISSYEGMYLSSEEIAQDIADKLGAKIVTSERLSEVISYYAYAPGLQKGIFVQGELVNLHIALSKEQCTVGTPIIFGGF